MSICSVDTLSRIDLVLQVSMVDVLILATFEFTIVNIRRGAHPALVNGASALSGMPYTVQRSLRCQGRSIAITDT